MNAILHSGTMNAINELKIDGFKAKSHNYL